MAIDIHLPVGGAAKEAVAGLNEQLVKRLGAGVDFNGADTPHITLYLTVFECRHPPVPLPACVDRVKGAVAAVAAAWRTQCDLSVTNLYSQGSYAFANVTDGPCLQRLSDTVVNATYGLAQPNQTVPSWVAGLPEPERDEKTALVRRYGSPNVFGQFQPHVTVGWASDAGEVAEAIAGVKGWEGASFPATEVAMGSVGAHGTVLKGKDLASFPLGE